jgi:hypothetical protein
MIKVTHLFIFYAPTTFFQVVKNQTYLFPFFHLVKIWKTCIFRFFFLFLIHKFNLEFLDFYVFSMLEDKSLKIY